MGGNHWRFDPVASPYNQSGELLCIEGHCQSSFALFLAIRKVCINRSATPLFHADHDRTGAASPAIASTCSQPIIPAARISPLPS